MTLTLQTAGEAMESLEKTLDLVARQAVEIERKRKLLADAYMALHNLSVYDTYETEYDGQIMTLCPCCGSVNGDHSDHCDFQSAGKVRAAITKELAP